MRRPASRRRPAGIGERGRGVARRRAALALLLALSAQPAAAQAPQSSQPAAAQTPPARIPDLFDPDHYIPRPDLSAIRAVRFLTTDDFPPFHFASPDGTLVGFDIDLTRAICRDLKIACTIQARRFDGIAAEIKAGHDDAAVAAIADTPASRATLDFTAPYYTTPARFVGRTGSGRGEAAGAVTPDALAGHAVGVEAGTAHEAYLRAFFPRSPLRSYRSQAELRKALAKAEVDLAFADAVATANWLNTDDGRACCGFRGGPFTESRYFGNGVSIAVAKGNPALRQALDYELAKLSHDGTYADLYLKYFPVGLY